MRILFVVTDINMGGAEIQLYRMCKYYSEKTDDEMYLISLMRPESVDLLNLYKKCGVEIYSLDLQRGEISFGAYIRFIRLAREIKPNVIHAHMIHANLLTRFARPFLRNLVVINTIHGEEEYKGKRVFLYKITDSFVDYTVACGKVLYDQAREYGIGAKRKLKFIYNVLDLDDYMFSDKRRKTIRESLNIDDDFVWMTVARLSEVKNQEYMINEFENLVRKGKDARLVIVGDGPLRGYLMELVEKKDMKNKIIFTGRRSDVIDLLCAADAFVLSSVHEGLPLSLQEAGAVGLPLVSTDVGGCNEVITEGENGYLCCSNEIGALQSAMYKLMTLDIDARHAMGFASRRIVEEKFDIGTNMALWRELYKTCKRGKRI